jgi:iron complex outermembrane receptor protein
MKNFFLKTPDDVITKLLRKMKLTCLLFILVISGAFATNAVSQASKVSLNLNNATVAQVINAIENQTDYLFVYDRNEINVNREVSVSGRNRTVADILDMLFRNTNVVYAMEGTNIILMAGESPAGQQQVTVTGKITDKIGSTLPGVTVMVKGSTTGTIADPNGRYSVSNVRPDAVLVFSFVGMRTVEVAVNNRTIIDIVLEEETFGIQEVVAIGYGSIQKRDVTGSVTNVSEKNFNKGVVNDAVDLLQGRVAGLNITQGSGDFTQEKTIRIRGTSSLSGSSEPLVVIDGIPGMSMNSIAPQDIESVSVLKDASAAAIYGSRAASGVILITTKKGRDGKVSADYNGYIATDFVSNKPDVLSAEEWRKYTSENNMNTQGLDLGGNTDWFAELLRVGVSHNHDLAFSGGNKGSNYRASVSYQDREGVGKGNYMERINSRLTFTQKALNDRLNISVTGAITERDYSQSYGGFAIAFNMLPVYPVKNPDGSWFDSLETGKGNPVRDLQYDKHLHKNSLYYLNLRGELELLKDLVFSVNLLKERESDDYGECNYDSDTGSVRVNQGSALRSNWTRDKKLLETTLVYKKELGAHKLNFLAGYSYEENYYQSFGAQNRQFATNLMGYNNLGAGENLIAGDVWSEANMFKLISGFGRINYSLLDRYILTATVREDGSSKFGANHKWGTFPSLSLAWRIIDEPFMDDVDFLEELKLRAGYGVSGNQEGIEPYKSLELYGTSGQYYENGNWYTAYKISQNANPDLKWEQTIMYNIGLDFTTKKNRLSGTLEVYNKITEDLLYTYNVPVPPYLHSSMLANVGTMSNKGIELALTGEIIQKRDLNWTLSVNAAHNKNSVTRLSNENFSTSAIKYYNLSVRGSGNQTIYILEEGKDIGTFYGWKYLGLDEAGKYIMDDMVDGVAGLTNADWTYIGSAQPELTYGIYNSLSYKKFEFSFFLRGVYGNDILNITNMSRGTKLYLPGENVLRSSLSSNLTDNPRYCSYYIEKGSFLRMDNASLSYTFDNINLAGINRCRLYFTAQNLFVITKYSGMDPEVSMDGLTPGLEFDSYIPKSRTFSLGINVNF